MRWEIWCGGKVRLYPWWPGQIFDEAFAVPSVVKTKKERHVLVAFFGDSSYGWFNPKNLIPFDPHYAEKSTKTNEQAFLSAVEDAENEACRRAALGLACGVATLLIFSQRMFVGFV
jgi:DNA (cytosine-5)-methyltransferase 3A